MFLLISKIHDKIEYTNHATESCAREYAEFICRHDMKKRRRLTEHEFEKWFELVPNVKTVIFLESHPPGNGMEGKVRNPIKL